MVRHEYMQGKGNVVRRMFREIDAQCYVMIDGDDTYPAEEGEALIDAVLNHNADMVVGDRLSSTYFTENKRKLHNFGNTIVRKSINRLFGADIKDVMTGYRAFSYRFVKTFPVLSQGFEIETEMTIHALDKNMQVENVVVTYRDRPEGSVSKLSTISDGCKVIGTIVSLLRDYKPLSFFGWIAFLLFLVSTVFLVPVVTEYYQIGLVPRFPTLIACGFVYLVSVLALFSGLILHNIRKKELREFEFRLQLAEMFSKNPNK